MFYHIYLRNILITIPALIVITFIINKSTNKLSKILHITGRKLRIPTTVRGATFDAISSSLPEFATIMIACIFYKKYSSIELLTIVGSSIFIYYNFIFKDKNISTYYIDITDTYREDYEE